MTDTATQGTSIAQIADYYGLDGGALIGAVQGLRKEFQEDPNFAEFTDSQLAILNGAAINAVEGAALVIRDYLTLVEQEPEASFAEFPSSNDPDGVSRADAPDGVGSPGAMGIIAKHEVTDEEWAATQAEGRDVESPFVANDVASNESA